MDVGLACVDHDNPDVNVRIQSLQAVAQYSLTEKVISEVLIPRFLNYLNDSEEVLLIIITQTLYLKNQVHKAKYVYSLFLPLEILCDIIEDQVRLASIQAIADLITFYDLTGNYLIILIGKLIKTQSLYSIQSAVDLIEYFLPKTSSCTQVSLLEFLSLIFLNDCPILLRHYIASMVSTLSTQQPSQIYQVFLQNFLKDDEDFVRVEGVSLLISLEVDVMEFEWILNDQSWKVRCFLAQKITGLLKENNMKAISWYLIKYLNDCEPEVKAAAFQSLVEFCKAIPRELLGKVLENVKALHENIDTVTSPLALCIISLCPVVGLDYSKSYLLDIITSLMKSEKYEVELRIIQQLKSISSVLGLNFITIEILPVILKLIEHKNWKIRIQIISQLPKISEDLGLEFYSQYLHSHLLNAFNDIVFAVRKEATKCLAALIDVFAIKWAETEILPQTFNWGKDESFALRITAVNILIEICAKLDFEVSGEEVIEVISRLCKDRISNVRVCVANLSIRVLVCEMKISLRRELNKSIQLLQCDEDQDVRWVVKAF